MTNGLPIVPLGEFLKQRKEFFIIDDFSKYKRARVQSHGQGIVLRDEISGTEIKTKKQQAARTGEFLVAEIDAKVGGFGIVRPELDGAVVSSHYFVFQIDEGKCSKEWLHWFVRYNSLEEQTKAQGSTNYAAIRPSDVLNFEIPLPPLREQRRIVAHIESLAARVSEAQGLREEADSGTEKCFASITNQLFTELSEKYSSIAVGKTFTLRQDLIRPTDGKSGKIRFIGLQHVESNTGRRIGEDALYAEQLTGRKFRFSPGEIVYGYLRPYLNKVWIADCEGVCSVDQYVIRPNEKIVDTKYLAYFMRSPMFLQRAIEMTHNLLLPRLRTGLLESILIPVPPLDEQRRLVAYLDGLQAKVGALRALQSARGEELSALMPSILDKAFKGEL